MENYVAFIMIMAIACGILDLMTDRWAILQKQLFPFILLLFYGLLIIRYYYGPDIWTYVPHYEQIPHPSVVWHHPDQGEFEWGYNLFCSLIHWIGLSYWGLTAVITTLYFLAVYLLLRQLPKRQIFALACIVMIDCHMLFHENRQCLAVSCFIFMVLLLQRRRYLPAVLLGVCTVLTHKSGFLPVALLLASSLLYNYRQEAGIYTVLTLLLAAMVVLPVQRISGSLVQFLPLPEDYILSISHHLQLGRQIQVIALIYLLVLFGINMYLLYAPKTRYTWIALVALVGMVCVVVFYQYYYLLNRVRSYFVPFVIFYAIQLMSDEKHSMAVPYSSLLKQSLMVLILVYYSHYSISLLHHSRQLHAPITRACTVFELRHASQKQIRDRQMKIANQYWQEDFMKSSDNKL